ncbi:TetR/AcrR family transcriptional regulator [Desulfoplanes sp. PS50]|jgi:TetR/AcrR family transcriptional regulator, fatty acid metabolism regulator protein
MSLKQTILETATRLFATNGFKNTSISAISKHSGAAEGTIFHHFKNKEDVFLCTLNRAKGLIINEVDEQINNKHFESGLEMVEAVINVYFYLSEEWANELSLLFRSHSYELASVNNACRTTMESIYNCFLNAMSEGIVIGIEDGSIANVSASKTAVIIFGMLNGLLRFDVENIFPVHSLYFDIMQACKKILTNGCDEVLV